MSNTQEQSAFAVCSTKFLSWGKGFVSLLLALLGFTCLAYLVEVIDPDFSTRPYSTWIFLGGCTVLLVLTRYKWHYPLPCWYGIIAILVVTAALPRIEQYTPDRLIFHHRMKEWKESGAKEVTLTSMTNFEWEQVITIEAYDESILSVCDQVSVLCDISIPWLHDKHYWTIAFIRKGHPIHLVRIDAKAFPMGNIAGGGKCDGNIKEDFYLVFIDYNLREDPKSYLLKKGKWYFVCTDSTPCIVLKSEECIQHSYHPSVFDIGIVMA